MTALLFATMLALPIAPLNPVEEDTLKTTNLHFTIGVTSPNGIISTGPEFTIKYEMLAVHPILVRTALDLKYAKATSKLFPQGKLLTTEIAADVIYYRGTNHLMGYIGAGAVYAIHNFILSSATADSLRVNEQVNDVDIDPQWGYRLTLGLRIHKSYSLEVGVTELRPNFVKWGFTSDGQTTRSEQRTRTSGFRLSVGYLVPISSF